LGFEALTAFDLPGIGSLIAAIWPVHYKGKVRLTGVMYCSLTGGECGDPATLKFHNYVDEASVPLRVIQQWMFRIEK